MRLLYTLHDQDWATTKSVGILKFSLALLPGLARDPRVKRLDVLCNSSLAPLLPGDLPKVGFHLAAQPPPKGWSRVGWDQWQLASWSDELQPDWLLLPKGFVPLFRQPRARLSACVHDAIFSFYAGQKNRPWPPLEEIYFERSLHRALKICDAVVTPSRFTADELSRHYRCRAVPRAIGEPLFGEPRPIATSADPRHLLLLASPYPHKLTAQALDWLGRFADRSSQPLRVTAVGRLPSDVAWPAREGWTQHGRLDETEFARVRASCGTLVYFSAYEGFGLPPLEALREGRRAIASDLPSHREHLPPEILFGNADYTSFHETLSRALVRPPAPVTPETAETVAARWIDALEAAPSLGAAAAAAKEERA